LVLIIIRLIASGVFKTVESKTVQRTAQSVCQKYAIFRVGRSVLYLKTIDDTQHGLWHLQFRLYNFQ